MVRLWFIQQCRFYFSTGEPAKILHYTFTFRPSIVCQWTERPNFLEIARASFSAVLVDISSPVIALCNVEKSIPTCLAISFLLQSHSILKSSSVIAHTSTLSNDTLAP